MLTRLFKHKYVVSSSKHVSRQGTTIFACQCTLTATQYTADAGAMPTELAEVAGELPTAQQSAVNNSCSVWFCNVDLELTHPLHLLTEWAYMLCRPKLAVSPVEMAAEQTCVRGVPTVPWACTYRTVQHFPVPALTDPFQRVCSRWQCERCSLYGSRAAPKSQQSACTMLLTSSASHSGR